VVERRGESTGREIDVGALGGIAELTDRGEKQTKLSNLEGGWAYVKDRGGMREYNAEVGDRWEHRQVRVRCREVRGEGERQRWKHNVRYKK
jgi:hypothetical protein